MTTRGAFLVGVNMPWGAFSGHDFGLRPHGWGSARQDWQAIERELCALRALGVRVVRWFVLGSGVNYPCRTGPERALGADGNAPQSVDDFARRVPRARGRLGAGLGSRAASADFEYEWTTAPPPLSQAFLGDFIALCRACQNAGLQLLPVLLSFEWFQRAEHKPKGVIAGGRARLVFGSAGRRDVEAPLQAFLDATLAPLLGRVSAEFGTPERTLEADGSARERRADAAHPIFAWESINEPDWVTVGGPRLLTSPRQPVPAAAMNALLGAFRTRVLAAGYDHSIGFKQFSPRWLDASLRAQLQADGARYWHQGHHYPTLGAGGLLEARIATNRSLPERPREFARCLVGEFPTGQGSPRTPSNARWGDRELRQSERDAQEYLKARLALIAQRSYDGAFLWSAQPADPDPRCAWNANTQQQLQSFTARLTQRGLRDWPA